MDDFIEYVERKVKDNLPRSLLAKALEYAKKHLPGLKNVLLDGCLEVDPIVISNEDVIEILRKSYRC